MEFKHKDRMSEAEQYVIQLQDIANKLDDFNEEVRMWISGLLAIRHTNLYLYFIHMSIIMSSILFLPTLIF